MGEGLRAYNSLNNFGAGIVAAGGSGNTLGPKAFITVLLYDKNYNFVDVTYKQISPSALQTGTTTKAAFDLMTVDKTVVEPGYAFIYISNEDPHLVDVYFDDLTITQTKTKVIQYNEYYPFGLQTQNSWTRESTTGNNFLANGGTELNTTSSLYDLTYRNYDPILGRFAQVDPLADQYGSHSPYNYAMNDPVFFNDPNGDQVGDYCTECGSMYGALYNSQWSRNPFTGRPAMMDDGWNPNFRGPVFVGLSEEGKSQYGLPTKMVWNPWLGDENSKGERKGGWALATDQLVNKIKEYGYELKFISEQQTQGNGSSSEFDLLGPLSRFLGSAGIAASSSELGLGSWISSRPEKLLNGTSKLHPSYINLNDKAFIYANRFLSGSKTVKVLQVARVTGIGATIAGITVSGVKIATGNGDGWDWADVGVNAVGLGATFFLASNPIGWGIGAGVLLYNGSRLAYDLLKD